MKPGLAIKILFRSPVRTALSIVLLGVVTFALFSQAAEYAITQREMEKAAAQYYGIGAVEAGKPYMPPLAGDAGYPFYLMFESTTPDSYGSFMPALDSTATGAYKLLSQEHVDAVSALPYVTSTDARLMTAGVSDAFYRMDDGDWFFPLSMRCIIEATVVTEGDPTWNDWYSGFYGVSFCVGDVKMLAGHLPHIEGRGSVQTGDMNTVHMLHGLTTVPDPDNWEVRGVGETNRMTAFYIGGGDYGNAQIANLTVGERYVFVLRYSPWLTEGPQEWMPESELDGYEDGYFYCIGDILTDSWCDAVWPLDGEPENYLELDKYEPLRRLAEITDQDSRTFDMVYTEDMASIMRFNDNRMEITEGRMLTREDSVANYELVAAPCVVSREFTQAHGLGIGDRITMDLGTMLFEQYVSFGAVASSLERYAPAVKTAELEIVGIFDNNDGARARSKDPHWCYSINTIFVPKTILPLDAGALPPHEYVREYSLRDWPDLILHDPYWIKFDLEKLPSHSYAPGEFSFRIDNARDIGPFLDAAEPLIWDMGLSLMFNDGGWRFVEQGFMEVGRLAVVKLVLFTVAVAAATALAVYLFIVRRKKDYAIMRALGTPKRKAASALALPLMATAAVSVLLGGGAACLYTMGTIARNNAFVAIELYAVDTSIPTAVVIGCALGQLLLTLAIALAMLRRIGSTPPLELLHGAGASRKQRVVLRAVKPPSWEGGSPVGGGGCSEQGIVASRTGDVGVAPPRHSGHDPESPVTQPSRKRSVSFVAQYISKHIRRSAVKSALAALLAALLFFAVGWITELRASYADLLAKAENTGVFMGEIPLPLLYKLVLPGYISEKYYAGLSKPVEISNKGTGSGVMLMVVTNDIDRYRGMAMPVTYDGLSDASTMDSFGKVLIAGRGFADSLGIEPGDSVAVVPAGVEGRLFPYKVIGIVEDKSDMQVYTPGEYTRLNDEALLFDPIVDLEVTLEGSGWVSEFRASSRTEIVESGESVTLVMNTASLDNLKNAQRLTAMLYPMAVAAALMIGGFLCCLIILQSSKEAAIMRVLGTTKGKTRAMLAAEQSLLSAMGLIAGMLAIFAYKGFDPDAIPAQMPLFAAFYFAMVLACGMACSSLTTRRSPLELLQVKE